MTVSADAVVIGAGVIGSSVALELARAGRSVVVLDRAGGVGHGSTSASSAIVRFHYSTWAGVALSWESQHRWVDWEAHLGRRAADLPGGPARFHRTGMLLIEGGSARFPTDLFDRAGIPWERWDGAEIARRVPGLDTGSHYPPRPVGSTEFFDDPHGEVTGTFTPDAGYVDDAALAAQNLAAAATAHGARFLLRRLVTGIDPGPLWRVQTDGGGVEAPVVVNAAGPWSGRVNALAGVGGDFGVSTRPLRQEVHQVSGDALPGIAVADLDLGTYFRPAPGSSLLVGGTEPECDPLEWLDDPDEADLRPTPSGFETQVTRAARRIPSLGVPSRPRGVAGVYDASSDWTPIYDRTAAPGFYVAMGTSGNQFKNAPTVGLLLRSIIEAVEGGRDVHVDPVRLHLPLTGHTVDLSAFSRLRRVDAGSPSSVLG